MIITLCGSTRFTTEMLEEQWKLTKAGHVVLSWCALPDSYFEKNHPGKEHAHGGDLEGVKDIVDEVHKRKIDLSEAIGVINVDGYVGTSTRSEIDYAVAHGKKVYWLESNGSVPSLDVLLSKEP